MTIECLHLHDYKITTSGDVPIELTLFVSAYRSILGLWAIEQFRVLDKSIWFDPEQGLEFDLIRPEHSIDKPNDFIICFVKHFFQKPRHWEALCASLEKLEASGAKKHPIR